MVFPALPGYLLRTMTTSTKPLECFLLAIAPPLFYGHTLPGAPKSALETAKLYLFRFALNLARLSAPLYVSCVRKPI